MKYDITNKVIKDKDSFNKFMNLFFIVFITMFLFTSISLFALAAIFMQPIIVFMGLGFLIIDIIAFSVWRVIKNSNFKSTYKSLNLDGNEAKYYLLGKKISPCCNAKMEKIVENQFDKEGIFTTGDNYSDTTLSEEGNGPLTSYGEIYKTIIKYKCPKCEKVFLLSELANR